MLAYWYTIVTILFSDSLPSTMHHIALFFLSKFFISLDSDYTYVNSPAVIKEPYVCEYLLSEPCLTTTSLSHSN
jgi:hypothetical protein